jgi:hypothetical protein
MSGIESICYFGYNILKNPSTLKIAGEIKKTLLLFQKSRRVFYLYVICTGAGRKFDRFEIK